MKGIEHLFLLSIYCPGFTALEEHAEHTSHIYADRDLNQEVLVCPNSRATFYKQKMQLYQCVDLA